QHPLPGGGRRAGGPGGHHGRGPARAVRPGRRGTPVRLAERGLPPRRRRGGGLVTARTVLLIAGAELRMLTRSVPSVALAEVLPTALGALMVWAESDTGKAGDGATAALVVVTLLALTAYTAGTT